MQQIDGRFVYSASDLNDFLECRHLTELERRVALGELERPDRDPSAELIARKGLEHEQNYLQDLRRRNGGAITVFESRPENTSAALLAAEAATIAAMDSGARLIYQATFFDGQFVGHADFLRRIEVPCARWSWSYEVVDTKLALNPKPYFIIQLCEYSSHLERIQGLFPAYGSIVLGNGVEQSYRLADYAAYYRHLRAQFLDAVADAGETYPLKCAHCKICEWSARCAQRRSTDDHLSLVAWMRRDQIAKLESGGIVTLEQLAQAGDDRRPAGMNPEAFAKLRRQATLQLRGRDEKRPIYELVDHHPAMGFGLLPQPARGDVFFDMEGDPFFEPGRGLEYLFGVWLPDDSERSRSFWALNRSEEKQAFETFIDFIVERRRQFSGMHVYHYANYEKAALRRLAQEHCTREEALDELLRGEIFVDLFAVVRQGLVISEESYGLKRLERFYGFERQTDVRHGDDSIVMFERWRDDTTQRDILDDIERYNRDDCRSLELMRSWLLERRDEAMRIRGIDIPFYVKVDGRCHAEPVEGCRKCDKRTQGERELARVTDLERSLLRDVLEPATEAEYAQMADRKRARYLLANLVAYHRRERKPIWWQYYDRCENADGLLELDKEAIAELELDAAVPPRREKNSWVYCYRFPDQPYKIKEGDEVHNPATRARVGTIFTIDPDENRLEVKTALPPDAAAAVRALIPGGPRDSGAQETSLRFVARSYLDGSLERTHPATLNLLLRRPPNIGKQIQPDEIDAVSVLGVVTALDGASLFIQGPPGTGKSTIASEVICDLIRAGKRVGVTANSHKAIHNLLHMVERCAQKRGDRIAGLYKHSDDDSLYTSELETPFIESTNKNEDLEIGDYELAGGTAWLFAREAMRGKFDYLFVDEAGQIALADAIAIAPSARNIILLGDPVQLAQVSQGRHPLHAGDSVLRFLLGERHTVAPDAGIFLERSWRMHPEICAFISDALYDGRLRSNPGAEQHRVMSSGLSGSGLRYLPSDHSGNSRASTEEGDCIAREAAQLLSGSVIDSNGIERPMEPRDIIVVTPYNAQRIVIEKRLREAGLHIRVGTVDKFQGQEAAVVFYSLASSSGDDMPRGVDFAFEPNRFNVAVSRAKCMSVVVCSPRLLDTPCKTAAQMAMVNLLCAYVEQAKKRAASAALYS